MRTILEISNAEFFQALFFVGGLLAAAWAIIVYLIFLKQKRYSAQN